MNTYDLRYMQLQQEKLENIIHKQQSVSSVAKELTVSRKTIYVWLVRYKAYGLDGLKKKKRKSYPSAHNRTSEHVEKTVILLAKQFYTEGVESLSDLLYADYAITLHPTTIYRILKRNNVRYGPHHTHTHKKWKKRLYVHGIPGTECQMDTSYPFGYKAGKVIYTIIDDASRWTYVKTYDKATAKNTVDFLIHVLQRAPFTIYKIRTDNGTEFINQKTQKFLSDNKIIHRRNMVGCPEQNGKVERFHQTLHKAYRYGITYDSTLDELQYKITLFTQYYNYTKRHRGLGMHGLTPMQKLEELRSVTLTLQCNNS